MTDANATPPRPERRVTHTPRCEVTRFLLGRCSCGTLEAYITDLESQLAALRADAGRLDWLQSQMAATEDSRGADIELTSFDGRFVIYHGSRSRVTVGDAELESVGNDIRSALDAARRGEAGA